MSKNSSVLRDLKRDQMIKKFAAKRAELRAKLKDPNLDPEAKEAASDALAELPRNSCPTRRTRRCAVTGRSKAVYRKFGLCRQQVRELGLRGDLPGLTKSSW